MIFHVSCSCTAATCRFTGEYTDCIFASLWLRHWRNFSNPVTMPLVDYVQQSRLGSDLLFRQMPFAWIEERSSIQASEIPNAICLNTRAPEVAIYRPDLFSPPGPAEFFINFSWNSDLFFESQKILWKASLCSRYKSQRTSWPCSSFDV